MRIVSEWIELDRGAEKLLCLACGLSRTVTCDGLYGNNETLAKARDPVLKL